MEQIDSFLISSFQLCFTFSLRVVINYTPTRATIYDLFCKDIYVLFELFTTINYELIQFTS